jgi:prepilin-type N-terminal cleavage/methylation domain-containing protein
MEVMAEQGKMSSLHPGFTLIELFFVIALVATISAIIFRALPKHGKMKT